jgi:hypothetical protein
MKWISTEDAAFKLTDSVFKSINHKMHKRTIFCDLAQPFDCVIHEILLALLHLYGIRGVSDDWFRSFLTNRRQKVEATSPKSTQNFFL